MKFTPHDVVIRELYNAYIVVASSRADHSSQLCTFDGFYHSHLIFKAYMNIFGEL